MAYELLPGTRAPVKMWADPAGVDPGALQQLRNVASLKRIGPEDKRLPIRPRPAGPVFRAGRNFR
jgi:hypothetical protein